MSIRSNSRLHVTVLVAVAAVVSLVAPPASAAPCADFTDVEHTNDFCANVEWLKNRGITLGCSSTTLYCPNEVVTRLSMAAFLNRLANALTPIAAGGILSGQPLDLDAPPVVCTHNAVAITGFPRVAHGHAALAVTGATGPVQMGATFVESTDNGATWSPVSPTQAVDAQLNEPRSVAVILPPRSLQIGSSYRYGVRVNRLAGAGTVGTDTSIQCEFKIFFENRNGASSPFDSNE